jgi:hypothetical protein
MRYESNGREVFGPDGQICEVGFGMLPTETTKPVADAIGQWLNPDNWENRMKTEDGKVSWEWVFIGDLSVMVALFGDK